jgi:hypothetical protein
MLTYSYTFSKLMPGAGKYDLASITVDSGKPTREEAFADLREYVTAFHGAMFAPVKLSDLRSERPIFEGAL